MFSFMGESGNGIELQGSWYLDANVGIDTKLQTNGQKVIQQIFQNYKLYKHEVT